MNELLKSIRNLCYSIFELTIAIVFLSIIFRQVEFNTLEKVYFCRPCIYGNIFCVRFNFKI